MKANKHSVVFTPQGKNLSALTLPVPHFLFSPLSYSLEGQGALSPMDSCLQDEGKEQQHRHTA